MSRLALSLARSSGLCRLCGASDQQRRVAREEKAGLGQWLFQCGHCQGLYLDPDMTEAALGHFYRSEYRRLYAFESCARPDEGFLHAIRCREIGWRRAKALSAIVPANGRVLEIGSGHGGFLGRLHGLRPDLALWAVEPDDEHRRLALDGADVQFIDWSELPAADSFDLIVMFHSLEHVLDPVGDLRLLAAQLSKAGRLVVEVPGVRPQALVPADIHPAHVTCFSAASLQRVVRAAGMAPQPVRAGHAVLPGCLWVEAMSGGVAVPPPSDDPVAVAPPRQSAWGRRCVGRVLPSSWRGKISRWRHGPALDAGLAEADGRVFCWGIAFDLGWTMDTLLAQAAQAMARRQAFRVADINVAKLIGLRSDAAFRMAVLSANAAVVDGMGVLWGLRWLGFPAEQRISGVDLLDRVAALCAERGWRPYIVGAKADVLDRAVERLRLRYPDLRLAGWRDGYFAADQDDQVAAMLAASGADCLIAALPYPRQDLFLAKVHAASSIPLAFGVGGSLDVLAGDRRRAPRWVQSAGLEWLFRLAQEPLRLGPRYVSCNGRFFLALLSQWVARRL